MRNSRFKLPEHTLNKLFDFIFTIIGKSNDKEKFRRILNDLFSKEERLMISKRIAVMYLLMKDFDYRTICDVLKVSQGTVAKFSIALERSDGIASVLHSILRKEQTKLFIEQLFAELYPPGSYGVDWKAAWERKNSIERKKQTGF